MTKEKFLAVVPLGRPDEIFGEGDTLLHVYCGLRRVYWDTPEGIDPRAMYEAGVRSRWEAKQDDAVVQEAMSSRDAAIDSHRIKTAGYDEEPDQFHVCETCLSQNITVDATADWNIEKQKWELSDTTEPTWCNDCDQETRLMSIPLEFINDVVHSPQVVTRYIKVTPACDVTNMESGLEKLIGVHELTIAETAELPDILEAFYQKYKFLPHDDLRCESFFALPSFTLPDRFGGLHMEHPEYPRSRWIEACEKGESIGYWEWVDAYIREASRNAK